MDSTSTKQELAHYNYYCMQYSEDVSKDDRVKIETSEPRVTTDVLDNCSTSLQ